MKKILYIITQSELGGAQRYCMDLAMNLSKNFDILFALGEQGDRGELAKQLVDQNIKYFIIPHLKRTISPINDFLALIETIKLIKKLKPDIIHLNSSKVSILGSLAAFLSKSKINPKHSGQKSKIIYTVHGWVFNEPLSSWKKLFYKYAEKFTALFKDKIICISKLDYDIAINQLKIPEKKLLLIHHGIQPINFLPREKALQKLTKIFNFPACNASLRAGRQLSTFNLVIGTIANLYKTKGLEYLIEATRLLIDLGFNIKTIVIGEGDERNNLKNLIAQNNLRSKFFLVGKIDNAAELLPAFDIYVSSSVKEGFPYTILEAMQAKLPIVATNVGGIPEMIIDGESGLLVNPQNPEELAQKIKILIEDGELRNTLSQQARKDVVEKFGIEKMIEKTKEVYLR